MDVKRDLAILVAILTSIALLLGIIAQIVEITQCAAFASVPHPAFTVLGSQNRFEGSDIPHSTVGLGSFIAVKVISSELTSVMFGHQIVN